ncbi:MAG: ABC transporter ATP-binding protein [Candidatus Didemnitutus sp.]|nr:ABC transporter ATP-binding protein [Candidatus Didemnitutus sp.]
MSQPTSSTVVPLPPGCAIRVDRVSKAYRIWRDPAARLKYPLLQATAQTLPRWLQPSALRRRVAPGEGHGYFHDFYALRDVSFELPRGETLGIVGRNGSGKSTLLQIIAGTLQPSQGTVATTGKIAALLELGSGFSPEFTGRENVRLNGLLLGLTPAEIDARMDDILAFADIGEFIDQPVKMYSSGMIVRLAFAVQVQVEPDILIVDEALSVGDAFFQHRCLRRMQEMLDRGLTLLFVSHDSATLRKVCRRCLLLDRGTMREDGETNRVLSAYTSLPGAAANAPDAAETSPVDDAPPAAPDLVPVTGIANIDRRLGDGTARITGLALHDADGQPVAVLESGAPFEVRVTLQAHAPIRQPLVGLNLYDKLRNEITATNSEYEAHPLPPLAAGEALTVSFRFHPPGLAPGIYSLDVAVNDGTQLQHRLCDWIVNAAVLELGCAGTFHGRVRIPAKLRHRVHLPPS